MSHPFPRNSPGSLRAMPCPGSALDSASIQCVPQTCQSPRCSPGTPPALGFPGTLAPAPFPGCTSCGFTPADEPSLTIKVQSDRMSWGQGHREGVRPADESPPGPAISSPSPPGVGGVVFTVSTSLFLAGCHRGSALALSPNALPCLILSFQSSPTPLAVCFLSLPSCSVAAGFEEVQRVRKLA